MNTEFMTAKRLKCRLVPRYVGLKNREMPPNAGICREMPGYSFWRAGGAQSGLPSPGGQRSGRPTSEPSQRTIAVAVSGWAKCPGKADLSRRLVPPKLSDGGSPAKVEKPLDGVGGVRYSPCHVIQNAAGSAGQRSRRRRKPRRWDLSRLKDFSTKTHGWKRSWVFYSHRSSHAK
jgi:hypothetical protein